MLYARKEVSAQALAHGSAKADLSLQSVYTEPLVHDLSEACRYIDYGAPETLVWFSGLHEPFLPRKILDQNKINGLLIVDANFDWFTTGVAGLADTFEASVEKLSAFLSRHPAAITIGGQSSGGYAALRMAHLAKPSLCIAFSPQTQNLHGQPHVHLPPIGPMYASQTPIFPVILHLARSERDNENGYWDDWAQVDPLMNIDNITVVRHPYDVHAVSLPLYSQGRFLEMIVSNMRLYAPVQEDDG